MKIYSSEPLPSAPIKWWKNQTVIFFNQVENQVDEENAGLKYESEMTVLEDNTDIEILSAIKRNLHDPELDYAVCANFEVEGKEAIKVKRNYPDELPQINKTEIIFDHALNKQSDIISSETIPVDEVIKKVSGGVKNYIVECIVGSRTNETDAYIEQLISDNNIIITAQ